jgi:hypothetical protein
MKRMLIMVMMMMIMKETTGIRERRYDRKRRHEGTSAGAKTRYQSHLALVPLILIEHRLLQRQHVEAATGGIAKNARQSAAKIRRSTRRPTLTSCRCAG